MSKNWAETKNRTTFKEYPKLAVKGFIMGAADVVPGVSGGTMALVLGIYDRLINAIKSFDTNSIKALLRFDVKGLLNGFEWKFLFMLLTGIFGAVLFFTKVVPLQELMFSDPEAIYGLYFGLILGSILLLIYSLKQITWTSLTGLTLGTVIGYLVVNLVPTHTPDSLLFVMMSGSIAICAMILPGISGSFLLLIMGKYQYILSNVSKIGSDETVDALIVLIAFGIGAVIGLVLFSRFLSWLLDRYYLFTITVLIGFLIGSLIVIWPFQERTYAEIISFKSVEINSDLHVKAKAITDGSLKPESYRIVKQGDRAVEIEVTKRKLIHSDPFIPSMSDAETDHRLSSGKSSLWFGWIFMIIGLTLIMALGKFAGTDQVIRQ